MDKNSTSDAISTPEVASSQTLSSGKSPKKKTGLIIGILIGLIVICGGVIAILLLGGKKDPNTIVYNALTNLTTSDQGGHENASISGSITIGSSGMSLYEIDITGNTNKKSLELNLGFNSPLLFGKDTNIGANLIFNQENLFAKIEGISDILGDLTGVDLSPIEGEWYKFPIDEMTEYFEDFTIEAESEDIDANQCISDELTTLNIKRDKLSELYRNHNVINAVEYNDTAIAKNKDQLYEISVDKSGLVDLINDILIDSKLFEDFYSCMGTSTREVEPIKIEDLEDIDIPVIYAEISKNDEFTRFYLPFEADDVEIVIDFTIDYPAKIEILEPTDAKSIEDLFVNLMSTQYDYDFEFEDEEEF